MKSQVLLIIALLFPLQTLYGADLFAVDVKSLDYPVLGLQAQISGMVHLHAKIDSKGAVVDVSVVSGNEVLASAAVRNLKTWKFLSPLRGADENVLPQTVEFHYLFKLQGETSSCPKTDFLYEHPNRVTVTSKVPHWMP